MVIRVTLLPMIYGRVCRSVGLTHTFISVGYPQSNGKLARFFGTAKRECIRKQSFLSIEDARKIIDQFIEYYNNKRLHSAIDYVAPLDIYYWAGRMKS